MLHWAGGILANSVLKTGLTALGTGSFVRLAAGVLVAMAVALALAVGLVP